jgi:hypothetical protein
VAVVVLTLLVAPILLRDPRAIEQYRALARLSVGGGGIGALFDGFKFKRGLLLAFFPLLFVGLWLSVRNWKTGGAQRWLRLWLGPLAGLAFILISVPGKGTYLWFLTPWLIVAGAAEAAFAWPDLHAWRRTVAVATAFAAVLLGAEQTLKTYLSFAGMPGSQTAEVNAAALAAIVPPGSSVLTTDAWWFLARDRRVYDARFACVDPSAVDYVVLGGNGSGTPGVPQAINSPLCSKRFPLESYEPIDDRLNRHLPTLFGRALTNSAYGFGNLVLRRKPPEQP